MTKQSAKKLSKVMIPLRPHAFEFCNSSKGSCDCGLSKDDPIHLPLPAEKRIVLMLNDFPVGVYTTEALANAAAEVEWKQCEPRWEQLGLTVGQSCIDTGNTRDPVRFTKYHYRTYEFVVDGEARL